MACALDRLLSHARLAARALGAWFYPALCPICHSRLATGSEAAICSLCALGLHHYREELHRGAERLYSCPLFGRLYALYAYQKGCAVQQLIHAIKYRGYLEAARHIGRAAVYSVDFASEPYDLVLAVPTEPRRLRQRGYNQALVMAQIIARALGIEATDRLIRRRPGSHTQTSLGRLERMDNMKHAFVPAPSAASALCGRRILLVDDVLTTGSTLTELCLIIEAMGGAHIDVFVAAVAI